VNLPEVSVVAVRVNLLTGFSMVTMAFGTTAFEGSVTVPLILPALPMD